MDGFKVWLLVGCAMACAEPAPERVAADAARSEVGSADGNETRPGPPTAPLT